MAKQIALFKKEMQIASQLEHPNILGCVVRLCIPCNLAVLCCRAKAKAAYG